MKKCIFWWCGLFISPYLFAQTDSSKIIYDTVVVKEAPVIIEKTVYVPDSSQQEKSWLLGINVFNANLLKNTGNNDLKMTFNDYTSAQLYLGKKFGNTFFSLGVGFRNIKTKYSYSGKYNKQGVTQIQVNDTIDTYYKIINGVSTPQYNIETSTLNKYETYQKDTTFANTQVLKYIDVPLKIGYNVKINKFLFTPLLGITTSFLSNKKQVLDAHISTQFSNVVLSGSAELKIGYQISHNLIVGVNTCIQKNLSKILTNSNVSVMSQNFGLDLQFLF